ncbi:hypothetical protein CBR_g20171 [Chara braunii]|uniref:Uncharacterized protein n=1 Tax=Chara braunii TaxID=69332 RepID=A0A388KZQ0_CHABU|nr:hypothetical protein CBR_g20171 [Chara braunii]|eukprot:GBG75540.1 hypothetical protein CBR_g20171 [Chara braunii]
MFRRMIFLAARETNIGEAAELGPAKVLVRILRDHGPVTSQDCWSHAERGEGRMRAAIRARQKRMLQSTNVEGEDSGAICNVVLQVCYAMGCGAFPRATPRWWMQRRTGGTWQDLRQCDDATADYFKDKQQQPPKDVGHETHVDDANS